MSKAKGKTPEETAVTMTELVLPNDTNLLQNLKGGRLMHWMDIAGALVASRHANKTVATVSVDSITFHHPIRMGEMVVLKAKAVYVGTTSIHTVIEIFAENLRTGAKIMTNRAKFVYVALDENGRPTPVPPLLPQTEKEIEDYKKAEAKKLRRQKKEKPQQ